MSPGNWTLILKRQQQTQSIRGFNHVVCRKHIYRAKCICCIYVFRGQCKTADGSHTNNCSSYFSIPNGNGWRSIPLGNGCRGKWVSHTTEVNDNYIYYVNCMTNFESEIRVPCAPPVCYREFCLSGRGPMWVFWDTSTINRWVCSMADQGGKSGHGSPSSTSLFKSDVSYQKAVQKWQERTLVRCPEIPERGRRRCCIEEALNKIGTQKQWQLIRYGARE